MDEVVDACDLLSWLVVGKPCCTHVDVAQWPLASISEEASVEAQKTFERLDGFGVNAQHEMTTANPLRFDEDGSSHIADELSLEEGRKVHFLENHLCELVNVEDSISGGWRGAVQC